MRKYKVESYLKEGEKPICLDFALTQDFFKNQESMESVKSDIKKAFAKVKKDIAESKVSNVNRVILLFQLSLVTKEQEESKIIKDKCSEHLEKLEKFFSERFGLNLLGRGEIKSSEVNGEVLSLTDFYMEKKITDLV